MKKKTSLIVLLILVLGSAHTGIFAQEAIPAAGGNASGSGGSVSFSVGQVFYLMSYGTNGSVLQGVQQPYEISEAEAACLNFIVHVFLEGAAVNPDNASVYQFPMRTTLNDKLMLPGQTYRDRSGNLVYTPAGQPYSAEPWNYPGIEGNLYDTGGTAEGNAGYPATVVDWVLVSLRSEVNGNPLCRKSALLHNDGTIQIVGEPGCCDLNLSNNYYLVLEHRNHLIVMSDKALPVTNGALTYDFTVQQSYLDPLVPRYVGQKLTGTKYMMYAGNGLQVPGNTAADTDITSDDQKYWSDRTGLVKYLHSDYNLNGDTNSNDQVLWVKNSGLTTGVPRN